MADGFIPGQERLQAIRIVKRHIAMQHADRGLVRQLVEALMLERAYEEAQIYAEALDMAVKNDPAAKKLLAQAYYDGGKRRDALVIARQWTAIAPGDIEAWRCRASAAIAVPELYEAMTSYRQVFALDPTDHWTLSQFFFLAYSPPSRPVLITFLRDVLANKGASPASRGVAAGFLALLQEAQDRTDQGLSRFGLSVEDWKNRVAKKEFDQWATAVLDWLKTNPSDSDARAQYVAVQTLGGHLPSRGADLEKFCRQSPGSILASYGLSPEFFERINAMGLADIARGLPPTRMIAATPGPIDDWIFVGCDQAYFDNFISVLIGSAVATKSTCGFHIHVFDYDEASLQKSFTALTRVPGLKLRITGEKVNLERTQARLYFHAMRFVRFIQYIEEFGGPAVQLDADLLFQHDPRALFDGLAGNDTGLILLSGRNEVHNQIAAGAFGVAPTPLGRRYALLVAAYLKTLWTDERMHWGSDQTALYLVLRHLWDRDEVPGVCAYHKVLGDVEDKDFLFLASKVHEQDPTVDAINALREKALKALDVWR